MEYVAGRQDTLYGFPLTAGKRHTLKLIHFFERSALNPKSGKAWHRCPRHLLHPCPVHTLDEVDGFHEFDHVDRFNQFT